jgi:hypothetical protein
MLHIVLVTYFSERRVKKKKKEGGAEALWAHLKEKSELRKVYPVT